MIRTRSPSKGMANSVGRTLQVLFAMMLSPIAAAQQGRSYLDMSGGYKSGDFGTATRSQLYYVAPALGYLSPTYDVSVTVPLLLLDNGNDEQTGMMNTDVGIGDIVLRAGRELVPESDHGFSLDGALALKLPTADEAKGLGTGESDYGAFLGLHQMFGELKWSVLSGYLKTGDSASVTYDDGYLYGIGLSRRFGITGVFGSLEGRSSAVSGADNPREINLGFYHMSSRDYAFKGSTFFGLNDGGPDFGITVGMVRWF